MGKDKVLEKEGKKGRKAENLIDLPLGNLAGKAQATDRSAVQQSQKERLCLETTIFYHVQWLSLHIGRWSFFSCSLSIKKIVAQTLGDSHIFLEQTIFLREIKKNK